MKVFVDPPRTMSRAMFRVSSALKTYAPAEIEFVSKPELADLQVLHVIGVTGMAEVISDCKSFAVIQYCLKSAGGSLEYWKSIWDRSRVVWSYYDLPGSEHFNFHYAPLGVDGDIFRNTEQRSRDIGVVTSGYVSGPQAEAIEEIAVAAASLKLRVRHIGPNGVVGMKHRRELTWSSVTGVSDNELAKVFSRSRWVSGLRQVEGFELPVLEGAACGARPIVFQREDMQWFKPFAVFVRPSSGPELISQLTEVLRTEPQPIFPAERERILEQFSWKKLVMGFWDKVL